MTTQEKLRHILEELLSEDPEVSLEYAEASIQKLFESPVREFHEVFGHPIRETPTVPPLDQRILRVKLLLEEVIEFAEASGVDIWVKYDGLGSEVTLTDTTFSIVDSEEEPKILKAADALADIRYVTDGAFLTWGLPDEALLQEVHRSNMTKLGEDGKPIRREDGKIVKGPNYEEPNIAAFLEEHGWRK